MRSCFTILLILLMGAVVFHPSPQPVAAETCLSQVQVWYDSIDAHALASDYKLALSSVSTERLAGGTDYLQQVNLLDRSAVPDCVQDGWENYRAGLLAVFDSTLAFQQSNLSSFYIKGATGFRRIGEFRGYLTALGVDVLLETTDTLYFK